MCAGSEIQELVGEAICRALGYPGLWAIATVLRDAQGSSGETFVGLIPFLARFSPLVYFGENVEDLLLAGSDNRSVLIEALADIGYIVEIELLAHKEFGGCTQRRRAFIVAINPSRCNISFEEAMRIAEAVFKAARAMQVASIPISACLLSDKNPYIAQTFQERLDALVQPKPGAVTTWQEAMMNLLDKKNMSWSECTVPDHLKSDELQLLMPRELMTLAFKIRTADGDRAAVDCSQSVDRGGGTHADLLATLTPGIKMWLQEQKRLMRGIEFDGPWLPLQMLEPSKPPSQRPRGGAYARFGRIFFHQRPLRGLGHRFVVALAWLSWGGPGSCRERGFQGR